MCLKVKCKRAKGVHKPTSYGSWENQFDRNKAANVSKALTTYSGLRKLRFSCFASTHKLIPKPAICCQPCNLRSCISLAADTKPPLQQIK